MKDDEVDNEEDQEEDHEEDNEEDFSWDSIASTVWWVGGSLGAC